MDSGAIQGMVWGELNEGPRTCLELSESLGISPNTVRTAVYRLRMKGWNLTLHESGGPYVMQQVPGVVFPERATVNRESLLELIKEGTNAAEDLAERFGVQISTIQEAVRDLRREGFPIVNLNSTRFRDGGPTFTHGADERLPIIYVLSGVKRNPAGRRCAHEGCITTLSVYNPDKYCYLHEREHDE